MDQISEQTLNQVHDPSQATQVDRVVYYAQKTPRVEVSNVRKVAKSDSRTSSKAYGGKSI